jgi:hypothetical protein
MTIDDTLEYAGLANSLSARDALETGIREAEKELYDEFDLLLELIEQCYIDKDKDACKRLDKKLKSYKDKKDKKVKDK